VNYYGVSYIGRRSSNQDRFLCVSDNGYTLLAVADGMGGHQGGEIASQLAVDILEQTILTLPLASFNVDLRAILKDVFDRIDSAIAQYVEHYPAMRGMGTTLSCALITGNRYVVGNIGDSRVYLQSDSKVAQITLDDTYIQEYIKQYGNKVPQDVLNSGHVLTKALNGDGDSPNIYPQDNAYYTLYEKDILILLSDGLLLDKVGLFDAEIARMLSGCDRMKDFCEQLICNAYYNGSKDNCTVVVGTQGNFENRTNTNISYHKYPPHLYPPSAIEFNAETSKVRSTKRFNLRAISGFLVLFAIVTIVVILFSNSAIFFNGESESNSISQNEHGQIVIDWPRGFVLNGDPVVVSAYSDVEWDIPKGSDNVVYIISIYQNSSLMIKDSTNVNKFNLSELDTTHDNRFQLRIEAMVNGSLLKPTSNDKLSIILDK